MIRTIPGDDRSDANAFTPIPRARLLERLAGSATYPIALLIAPAGYGKSVVLRQYLRTLDEPYVRFTLGEHTTLLSFLRGFSEALRESAPYAITALAGAYERNTASPKRGPDLARWMHAHLESFRGVIAIDDLHVAEGDPEVARFLTALIERTKGRIRWILASRSTTGLPVGTWLAYRDADLCVDERALNFTLEEAREAAVALGLSIRDEELSDLLSLTEGWPAAMSFALRTSIRSSDLRNISALTREMIYRFLAEQVYAGLDEDERAFLEVAIALPAIDVEVLERAGFDCALTIVERLCKRTAFIYEESPGIYQCHDLFREFLHHQSALGGNQAQKFVHERAAHALEASGDVEHAIASFASAGSQTDVVRLLERSGFDLLERARGDVVARAIEALSEEIRRDNATVLALHGSLQAIGGKFARAESLLRRSLARAANDRELIATASLRLASMIGNQGGDVFEILGPVAGDNAQGARYRAEALSLIGARLAIAADNTSARRSIEQIKQLLPEISSDITRAKVLHHLGIIYRHVGDVNDAIVTLIQAGDLAAELHLYGLASRVNAVLSNLALHEEDDVSAQGHYAELAAAAATKAGDAFALQTALLQLLSAEMRQGHVEDSIALEQRLTASRKGDLVTRYVSLFRAERLAWEGRFGEARGLIASSWSDMNVGVDRISCGAQAALFVALDGSREESIRLTRDIVRLSGSLEVTGLFGLRSLAISQMICVLAEAVNGRLTNAEQILRRIDQTDMVIRSAAQAVRDMLWALRRRETSSVQHVLLRIRELQGLGYSDAASLFSAVSRELEDRARSLATQAELTPSEREILRLLARGLVPKEVAAQTGRSIYTVRAHVANAIAKLECHGRYEAVRIARQRGII